MDIVEGITEEQARQMAENLEFKGPALEEVICTHIHCDSTRCNIVTTLEYVLILTE